MHEASGAATELCAILRRDRLGPLTADDALRMQSDALAAGRTARLMANPRSGRAALVVLAPAQMLGAAQVRALRIALGRGGDIGLTAEEVYEAVLDRGTAFPLANGWRLARRRAMGMERIKVERTTSHRPAGAQAPRLHHRNRRLAHPRVRARRGGARSPPRPLAPRRGRARGSRSRRYPETARGRHAGGDGNALHSFPES